jgi:hypothetical protein
MYWEYSEGSKAMTELTREQLRQKAAQAVQDWGVLLAKKLGIDESWRLLLAGAVTVAQAEFTPNEIAEMLHQLADSIDAGGLESPKTELN